MADSPPTPITVPITVNAWGVTAGGTPPHFKLLVDGVTVGEAWVRATDSTTYSFQVSVDPDVGHSVTVWYDNDGTAGGVDRNLYVGSIGVDGQTIASTDVRASYDKGAYDGKDVAAGQTGLFWGGALSFGLGEELFGGPVTRPPPAAEPVITRTVGVTVAATGAAGTRFTVLVDGQAAGTGTIDTTTGKATLTVTATLDPTVAHGVRVVPEEGAAGGVAVTGLTVNGRTIAVDQTSPGAPVTATVAAPVFQGMASQAPAPSGTAYYVATNGNDAWSGKLAAPNADGTDGPFATLARAQQAMRAGDVKTTYVREGTYHLSQTLQLTGQDSGTSILGYPGEQVVLSGGQTVTGFTSEGNGVWSAALGTAPGLDISVGGTRYDLASKAAYDPSDPTSGWYFADAAAGGASATALRYHAGDASAADLTVGSKIEVFDTERLQNAILDVAGIDDATRTITFKTAAPFALDEGSTYRLLGNASYVDQVGEYAYRASDGRLVIDAGTNVDGATLNNGEVEVARLGTLVRLSGATGVTLQGLTFANTTTTGNALELSGADDNRITGNSFLDVGTAIHLAGGSDANLVAGNYLDQLGVNGVLLEQSDGNIVTGNQIQRIGQILAFAAGIMGSGISGTEISHNDIDHSARYGISLKDWSATTVNLNNKILDNRVRHTGEETADSGGIEVLGRSGLDTGTLIQGNWVEHTGGLATNGADQWLTDHKGFGIYLDDMASGVTVQGNFLRDTAWASVMIHGGHDNTVTGNIAVLASNDQDFLRIEWVPLAGAAGNPHDNTVTRNIVEGLVPLGSYLTLMSAGTSAIDFNFLHNVAGYGANDTSGDPLFSDAYDGDYSLTAGSPVFAFGIQDLDWAAIGVRSTDTGSPASPPGGNGGVGSGGSGSSSSTPPPSPPASTSSSGAQGGGGQTTGTQTGDTPTSGSQTTAQPQSLPLTTPFSRIVDGRTSTVAAAAYEGPVATLQWMFIGDSNGEVVGGSTGNDFMNLLAGDDAASGGAGDDVLDGGTGSNWLVGGSGTDTFFIDGRNSGVTWSTITDLETGEWTTLWGYREGVSKLTWEAMSGAGGYQGATVRCDIDGDGGIDASVTFAGVAASALTTTMGNQGGTPYIAFVKL